jgi:hypothetical protein
MNGLQTINHGNQKWSMKDLDRDYDIHLNDSKWNDLFKSLISNTKAIYFNGGRENYKGGLAALINNLAEEVFDVEQKDDSVLIKIKDAHLIISRKQVEEVWLQYEHASLILLKMKMTKVG